MDRFILIDGNAIIHRAFHALPPLTSSDGQIMNAVYGFFSMFLKIQEDFQPKYMAVCFDRPKPSFRQEMYVGYQAKRPKMSDDLPPQFVKTHEVLEAGKVPIFEVDGYEADDLIGTLSVKAALKENIETIIVSGDRDLLQLVNKKVKVCTPVVGLTKNVLYDEVLVEEKYGIKPAQFIDYKALVGDNSDNYPGVAGIGPKTAADLIRKYQTFENLYQHISELPEKVALRLATDAEQAALAKKLATIILDAPSTLDMEKCLVEKFDKEGMVTQFDILGFESLMKRVRGEAITRKPAVKEPEKPKEDDEQLGLL
jgi:DNA polymerase-1